MGTVSSTPGSGYFFQEDFITPNLGESQVISVWKGTNVNRIPVGSYEEFLQWMTFLVFAFLFIFLGESLVFNWLVYYDLFGFLFMFAFLYSFINIGKRINELWVVRWRDALFLDTTFVIEALKFYVFRYNTNYQAAL